MTIHEFGKDNKQIVVLIHPSAVMWDYFEYVIPLLEDRYHLIDGMAIQHMRDSIG